MTSSAGLSPKTSRAEPSTDVHLSNAFQVIDQVPFNTLLAHQEEVVQIFHKLYKSILADASANSPPKEFHNVPHSASALLGHLDR